MLKTFAIVCVGVTVVASALAANPPRPTKPGVIKCWNCGQWYEGNKPKCPYCDSPKDKPKYR